MARVTALRAQEPIKRRKSCGSSPKLGGTFQSCVLHFGKATIVAANSGSIGHCSCQYGSAASWQALEKPAMDVSEVPIIRRKLTTCITFNPPPASKAVLNLHTGCCRNTDPSSARNRLRSEAFRNCETSTDRSSLSLLFHSFSTAQRQRPSASITCAKISVSTNNLSRPSASRRLAEVESVQDKSGRASHSVKVRKDPPAARKIEPDTSPIENKGAQRSRGTI